LQTYLQPNPRTVEIFRGPSAYSGMDTDGEFVMFEGGAAYLLRTIVVCHAE
jgi:hypothetical protein